MNRIPNIRSTLILAVTFIGFAFNWPASFVGTPVIRCFGEQPGAAFTHPGIAHTRDSIDFVRERIAAEEEPWTSAWKELRDSRYASLDWQPKPLPHVQRGPSNNPNIGSSDFTRDGASAYTHALHWVLSGDARHAQKSAEIIDAWSSTLQSITNHDARLLVGMDGQNYCNAAELLKHTWDGWPEENQIRFATMARQVWYPVIEDFYPSANGNWDASMIQTMIAMGIFLEDREMFQRGVQYFLHGEGNGAITNYFNEFGECQESGRDQGHTQMGLEYLANACEFAWNQGVDLYAASDNRLLRGFEYTAKYNLGFDVPYEPYRSFEGRYHYKRISDDGRGGLRSMYEKVFNHYHNRRGLKAEYTEMAALKLRARMTDNRNDDRRRRRDRRQRSTLLWDTLMYAEQPAAFTPDQSS